MKETQVIKNAKAIVICKIVQSVLQLIIGMITARYLGPSNYGLINYAASIVAFVIPFVKLGLDAVLVFELVKSPEKEGEIMGTSLFFSGITSLFGIAAVSLFVTVVNYGEADVIAVCILHSLSVFFGVFEMLQYWFQYKLMSKYSSAVMLVSYLCVSAYKIFLLITSKSVAWFAFSHSVEYITIGLLLFWLYRKKGGTKLSVSLALGKEMLQRSKHYILASLMVVVIQNTDHIMITSIVGEAENGLYSASITCVTMLQFVYVAIVDSFRPFILEEKKRDEQAYENAVKRVYSVTLFLSIMQAIAFSVFAELIIWVLYGSEYLAATNVMRILSFYFVFSLMGLLRNVWILAEEKQKYLPIVNVSGALFNIALNAIMIPHLGAFGAAVASLITQAFANFVLSFIIRPLRKNNTLILQSLNPVFFLKESKEIARMLIKK